jgi:O-antigen ligase
VINIAYWTFIGIVRAPSIVKPILIIIGLALFLLPFFEQVFAFVTEHTFIGFRFTALKEEGEETLRVILLKTAFEYFLKSPWLGVGAGNFVQLNPYHLFSHNNFVEILVNQGIFAFGAYLMSLVSFAKEIFYCLKGRLSIHTKKILSILILFLISFIWYSFLYPFFKVIPFVGFIFVAWGLVYRIKRNETYD